MLIDKDGILKISDFGLSVMFDGPNEEIPTSIDGTPAYFAPECCQEDKFMPRPADIWAMGATIYVLLYGCIPFASHDTIGICKAIVNAPLVIPRKTNPDLESFLRGVLERIQRKDLR